MDFREKVLPKALQTRLLEITFQIGEKPVAKITPPAVSLLTLKREKISE